jgi:hypothetical protein
MMDVKFRNLACGIFLLALPLSAAAATKFSRQKIPYTTELRAFKPSMRLPITQTTVPIEMPISVLQTRLHQAREDARVEPVSLPLREDGDQLRLLVRRLARAGREGELMGWFKNLFAATPPIAKGSPWRRVELDDAVIPFVQLTALAKELGRNHREVQIRSDVLQGQGSLLDGLLKQVSPYLQPSDRRAILGAIAKGEPLSVDEHLLPNFARQFVGRFVPYRGLNCFHAALAFQNPSIPRSTYVNVKEEAGYHRSMINYDELWRVIRSGFYEVDPHISTIKYGDMMVFFELEAGHHETVDFRTIRHTTTYLFNDLTFSKGSKSPDTPYSIKTLGEEWETWRKIAKNMGVKVFRKKSFQADPQPPVDLVDWIY